MSVLSKRLRNLKDHRNTKDPGMRETIVKEYAPLVKFIAQKIAARLPANVELDDLISCGVIGLIDAIEKFDSSRDNKFKTYAEFRVRGAILDELRSQDWVPRSVRDKAKLVERTYQKLERDLGRVPTEQQMCSELKISSEEYHQLLDKAKSVSVLSLDDSATMNRDDKKSMMGFMETSRRTNPFAAVNFKKSQERIKDVIKTLPEKQRLVLSLYYYEDLNLKEIGQVLDVTESRVSQLHTQAVNRLKAGLKDDFDSIEDLAA